MFPNLRFELWHFLVFFWQCMTIKNAKTTNKHVFGAVPLPSSSHVAGGWQSLQHVGLLVDVFSFSLCLCEDLVLLFLAPSLHNIQGVYRMLEHFKFVCIFQKSICICVYTYRLHASCSNYFGCDFSLKQIIGCLQSMIEYDYRTALTWLIFHTKD